MKPAFTMADVRDLDFGELVDRLERTLSEYDAPQVETQGAKIARLGRTLDEIPAHYRWLLQQGSWLDHWTDACGTMFGMKDSRYKALRQRRDLLQNMARAAKLRYEAASRTITVVESFAPDGTPRSRSVASD